MPQVSKDLACTLFEQIIETGVPSKAAVRKAVREAKAAGNAPGAIQDPPAPGTAESYASQGGATVSDLFGGSS